MGTAATLEANPVRTHGSASRLVSRGVALVVVTALLALGVVLYRHEQLGSPYTIMLLGGAAFGVILQRTRFCLFCIFKDFYLYRNGRPLLAVIGAIAIGSLGYLLIFESWVPDPSQDWLPPQAHIGPAGLHLVGGGLLFGLGMALSGSCISSHLYRLGEGSALAVPSLLGAAAGFGLGFAAWNPIYTTVVQPAPVVWFPRAAGYGGAALIQVGILAVVAALILVRHRAGPVTLPRRSQGVGDAVRHLLTERWKPAVSAVGVGMLAFLLYFKVEPLGVTAELGRLSRNGFTALGVAPARLQGLDSMAGCSTAMTGELVTTNALFVGALVAGSLASALAGGYFRVSLPSGREAVRGFGGGVLLGFGAMISLGCSIGTFLSGSMALSLSGWIFGAFMALGIWLGIRMLGSKAEKAGCSAPPLREVARTSAKAGVPAQDYGTRSAGMGGAAPGASRDASGDVARRMLETARRDYGEGLISAAELLSGGGMTGSGIQIAETGRSRDEFEQGHVPGAVHVLWERLWRPIGGVEGMLPPPGEVAATVGELGLDPERPVVVYDHHGGARAGRLLFVLDMLGFRELLLLDGGLDGWISLGAPLEQGKVISPGFVRLTNVPDRWSNVISLRELAARLNEVDVLDTRTPEEFHGVDVRARHAGRIPGAVNIDWRQNIDPRTRTLESPPVLRELYQPYLESNRPLVLMCQSGRRSCQSWYVLRLLGRRENVLIYDGSWTEWGNRDDVPIETG